MREESTDIPPEGWRSGYEAARRDMVARDERFVQELREEIIRELAEKLIVLLDQRGA